MISTVSFRFPPVPPEDSPDSLLGLETFDGCPVALFVIFEALVSLDISFVTFCGTSVLAFCSGCVVCSSEFGCAGCV